MGGATTHDGRRTAVSVVVPCRNEVGHIESFLRGVLAQECPVEGGGIEVIVADGSSDDGTRARIEAVAKSDPRVRLIDNPLRIASTGLNAAILASRGGVIVRMDVHTEYAPDYVRQCLAVLKETGADNVGGPARTRAVGYLPRAIAAAYHSPFAVGGARFHDPDYEGGLDTVTYGCWRRETFEHVGMFDEELARNQDDEHNLRLTLAGGRVWQSPRIKSWYRPRSSLGALFTQYSQYGYWKVRVIQKHGRPASVRHLVPVLFVTGLLFGPPAAWLYRPLIWVYVTALGVYALAGLASSVRAARGQGAELIPVLPFVFLIYHLGYGTGFLLGLVDFAALRRGPRRSMAALTRGRSEASDGSA